VHEVRNPHLVGRIVRGPGDKHADAAHTARAAAPAPPAATPPRRPTC
jgi:hypothetical protein